MEQTPSRTEVLAKRLEETWGRVQPSARLPDDVSSRITPQENVLWEPDPKPLMANHPTRVTDSNTRIFLSEGALTGPCPRDDSGLGWVYKYSVNRSCGKRNRGFLDHHQRRTHDSVPPGTRMDYYQWNVEHPSYDVGPDHGHTDENSRIMQNPISPGKCRRLHPNETHPPGN